MDKVILIEKHKISLIDSKTNGIKWKINVSDNITGTYRLDKYIFLYTHNWMGTHYTSVIDIDSGNFYWKDEKLNIVTNCVAIDNKLFFINKKIVNTINLISSWFSRCVRDRYIIVFF